MKILQVITSLETGGAETLVVNLVPKFRALGHEVDVCVFNGKRTPLMERLEKENYGIKIWRLGNGYYNLLYILKLMRIMKQYDIVHTHNSSPQLFVAMAEVLCSVGLCSTEHTTSNRKRGWKWYAPIESWMYGRYNHIICISQIAEEKLREYMGGDWLREETEKFQQISTVNNGVDVNQIYNAPLLSKGEQKQEGDFVTTMVAGFREAKDQDTLVRSLTLLPKNFKLWLVGIGARMEEVKTLAAELGVEDRVKFWGMRTDVPCILKSSDVVCMSSHWEGLSLSNVEGMSAGRPFIASDVDGLREVTKDYGLLFPNRDHQALATLIQQLHDDSAFYEKIAKRCYERAQAFDISKMVEGYHHVYEAIFQSKNKKSIKH
ncbi:MAG: glycosyltransferase family 4 protein [Prevotellaceae bacterium]|nr:glycosyltransferase family 4 protein [Prevotellaceae bacterium]